MKIIVIGLVEMFTESKQQEVGQSILHAIWRMGINVDGVVVQFVDDATFTAHWSEPIPAFSNSGCSCGEADLGAPGHDPIPEDDTKCEHGYGIKQGPCPTCDAPDDPPWLNMARGEVRDSMRRGS